MTRRLALCATALICCAQPAEAAAPFSCGGFAMLGGAQLACSHVDPKAPTQICTYSWALMTPSNGAQVASGSFLLPPGVSNATVYQGSGFSGELSPPIVLCQGKKSAM